MKKIIFYLLMLLVQNHVHASEYPNRPSQEVSFLGQEVPQAYGTARYHENPYEDPILGTVVTNDNRHLFNSNPHHNHESNLGIITGTAYLTSPSPRTSNSNLTTITLSPRTPTVLEQNSSQQCRQVAIIFLSAIGIGGIIGTTCYLYKSVFNHHA